MGVSTNSTVLTDLHSCYSVDALYNLTRDPSVFCVLFNLLLCALSAVTVGGNLLVITSVLYFKQLRTPANYLVLSLAMADLLAGLLVFPLTMEYSVTSCLYHHHTFCQVRATIEVLLCTASILILCCISIDRYHAVCQPLTYHSKINNRVVLAMVLASWGISALIAIIFLVAGMDRGGCDAACLVAYVLGIVFSFYLPMVVMLLIYLKILLVAQRQVRSIRSTKGGAAAVSKAEGKATKTLAIVMGLFSASWLPFFLLTTVMSFAHVLIPLPVVEALNWLALSNSTLNPFIYAFFYSWFRSAFRMIVLGMSFASVHNGNHLNELHKKRKEEILSENQNKIRKKDNVDVTHLACVHQPCRYI